MRDTSPQHASEAGPPVVWLAAGFLLAGLGTALLGPILPTVARQWHLTDTLAGRLFLPKFIGAFLGGISVSRRLRFSLISGTLLACAGFGAFALAPNLLVGSATLLVGGFGLGQMIASTNIMAGLRYRRHTGSALASLNFFWSLGAVITGVLAAALLPKFGLRNPLLGFAGLFLLCGAGDWLTSHRHAGEVVAQQAEAQELPLARASLVAFGLMLFLYGGLETCLANWLTTFSLRFSNTRLLGGQSAVVLFWASLTVGRALSSVALRFVRELTLQTVSVALAAVVILALAASRSSWLITGECVLLGLLLAPFFPATFALLMTRRPPARMAGVILAVSGLGAGLFPWLMGVVSTHAGSLRMAMLVPAVLAVALLVIGRQRAASPGVD